MEPKPMGGPPMLNWFKRTRDDNTTEPIRPLPRWAMWLMFAFLGYLVIVGNISTMEEPEGSVAVGPGPAETASPKDFPAIRRTFSLANWQRAFDPTRVEGLKIRDFTPGAGREAACGDEVEVKLRGRDSNGQPFDPGFDENKPVTFVIGSRKTYPAVEQAVLGMKNGGERMVDAPPALVYEDPARELSTLALQLTLTRLSPKITEGSAPLLLATNRIGTEDAPPGARCGETIGVDVTLWDESGKSGRKLKTAQLVLGARTLAIGMDHALPGMVVGETRTLLLPPDYQLHDGNDSPFDGKTLRLVEVKRVK